MGQLAVTAVAFAPLVVQRHDRRPLPVQQDRVPAPWQILQPICVAPPRAWIKTDRIAGGPVRPAATHGVVDQLKHAGLDGCVLPAGTGPAVSPNTIFHRDAAPPPACRRRAQPVNLAANSPSAPAASAVFARPAHACRVATHQDSPVTSAARAAATAWAIVQVPPCRSWSCPLAAWLQ